MKLEFTHNPDETRATRRMKVEVTVDGVVIAISEEPSPATGRVNMHQQWVLTTAEAHALAGVLIGATSGVCGFSDGLRMPISLKPFADKVKEAMKENPGPAEAWEKNSPTYLYADQTHKSPSDRLAMIASDFSGAAISPADALCCMIFSAGHEFAEDVAGYTTRRMLLSLQAIDLACLRISAGVRIWYVTPDGRSAVAAMIHGKVD